MNGLFEIIEVVAEIAFDMYTEAKKEKASDETFDEKIRQLYQSPNEEVTPPSHAPYEASANPISEPHEWSKELKRDKRKYEQLRTIQEEEERAKAVSQKRRASRKKVRQMILHQEIMNKPMSMRNERGL